MAHFPIFTDLAGRKCLVVGEGESADAKVRSLLDAGAVVTLIAKQPSSTTDRVANDRLVVIEREHRDGDMESFLLVYGCTTDRQLAQSLFAEASRRKILINIPDMPEYCSFISPAIVRRGDLSIAISTSGASPALSRRIREQLESVYGPEYAEFAAILKAARIWLRRNKLAPDKRRDALTLLARSPIPELLAKRDRPGIEALLENALGKGATLDALGFPESFVSDGHRHAQA
jgi:precorrin-2 dehydrogenase/sirohydrochlorin ferrochelatase